MASVPQRKEAGNDRLAAIYVRVSSKEQAEDYSLDAQRRACEGFGAARGYTVVAHTPMRVDPPIPTAWRIAPTSRD